MPARSPSDPKYAPGIARVEAILEAAAEVFAERGFEAATMTEIAARSGTAIGSMYRFFPTREALGERLLERYQAQLGVWASSVAQQAKRLSTEALTDMLFDALAGGDAMRAGARAVLEAHGHGAELRMEYRTALRRDLERVLKAANPKLSNAQAKERAAMLVYIFKGISRMSRDEPAMWKRSKAEQRRMVELYLGDVLAK
ncbi:MAG: TetR family transcriptional regulator [Archangium sp.]